MESTKLGELIIELGLESSKFNAGAQGLNTKLRTLQAQFKNAGAGIKDFGTSIDGLKAKQDMLSKSIEIQKQKVELYHKQFEVGNKTLEENKNKQEELKVKVKAAKSAYEESSQAIGENAEETQKLHEEYSNLQKELNHVNAAVNRNLSSLGNTEVNMNRAEASLKEMQAELKETSKELDIQSNKWKKLYSDLGGFDGLKDKFSKLGNALTKGLTVPLVSAGAAAVKTNIDFESAFTGVKKTLNTTGMSAREAEGYFEELKNKIVDMSTQMPASVEQISAVAEAAGQLGIERENLIEFTETMIKLGDTTNIVSEEASMALAKFANVTKMPQENFDKLGSTIVALGNNLETTEAEIVDVGTRIASMGTVVGLSQAEIMSFAGAITSAGVSAEVGGTNFSQFLGTINRATNEGGRQLEKFAKVAGMSAEQFKKAFETDAAGAIEKFLVGLGKSGKEVDAILKDLGLTSDGMTRTLVGLANSSDNVTKSLKIGNSAWEENNALNAEADQRYQTLESQLNITKNKLKALADTFGEKLTPFIKKANDKLGELIDTVNKLDDSTIENLIGFGTALAAIGPTLKVISAGMGAVKTLKELKTLLADSSFLSGLTTLTGLSSGTMLGVGAIGAGAGLGIGAILDKNKDKLSGFTNTVTSSYDNRGKGNIFDNLQKERDKMRQSLQQTQQEFDLWATNFDAKASQLWKKVKEGAMNSGQNIADSLAEGTETIFNIFNTTGEFLKQLASEIWNGIKDSISNALDGISGLISSVWGSVKSFTSSVWNGIKDSIINAMKNALKSVTNTLSNMVSKVTESVSKFKNGAIKMGQALIDGIKSKANAAKQAVQNTVKNMINAAKEKISSWKSIGSNMIKGLIDGIKSMASRAVDAAKNVVTSAINAAKNALGIHSPSRVFHEIGEYVDEGFANGIRAKSNQPVQAVREITNKMQAEMDKFLQANQNLVSDTNTVLDSIKSALSNKYNQMYETEKSALDKQLSALESWKDSSINAINARYDAMSSAIDAEIAALDRAYKEKQEKEEDESLDNRINTLKTSIEYEHNEENKLQMQKELENLYKEKEKLEEKRQYEREKQALQDRKQALQAEKEAEIAAIQKSYEMQKIALEEQMKKLKEFYDAKLKEERLTAEAVKMIQDKNQKAIIKLLKDYLPEYRKAGHNMGESLVLGMKPHIDELKSMIAGILADINSAKRQANALQAEIARNNKKNVVTNNNNNARTANYTINVQSSGDNVRDIDSLMRSARFSY